MSWARCPNLCNYHRWLVPISGSFYYIAVILYYRFLSEVQGNTDHHIVSCQVVICMRALGYWVFHSQHAKSKDLFTVLIKFTTSYFYDSEHWELCFRLEWESAVLRGSHSFQTLEEERLQQLKELTDIYLQHYKEVGPKLTQVVLINKSNVSV